MSAAMPNSLFTTDAFHSLKGRPAPARGDRVRVYRNLNKPTFFSILALDGPYKGKVLGYAPVVGMLNVRLKVSSKSREGVLSKGVRTVHAFAEGEFLALSDTLPAHIAGGEVSRVTYQPFVAGHFFDRDEPETAIWNLNEVWTQGPDLLSPT